MSLHSAWSISLDSTFNLRTVWTHGWYNSGDMSLSSGGALKHPNIMYRAYVSCNVAKYYMSKVSVLKPVLQIHIHWFRIWIQHFSWIPIWIWVRSRLLMNKYSQLKKFNIFFTKSFNCGSFLLSWIWIPNPDPDPLTWLNPDPDPQHWLKLCACCRQNYCMAWIIITTVMKKPILHIVTRLWSITRLPDPAVCWAWTHLN